MNIKYLYHASQNKHIEILEPRAESIRDPNEGPVVFATHDKTYATCFSVPTDDTWARISQYRSNKHPTLYVMCISDEKRFRDLDQGGAVYYLNPESFYLDESKSSTEWTSKLSAKPIKKELFESGLDAMIENGVNVFFCDQLVISDLGKTHGTLIERWGFLRG